MNTLINPKIEVKIFGLSDLLIKDLYMDFSIFKDVSEDPNDANITIYNLDENSRNELTKGELVNIPLEIYLSRSGESELVKAFAGEIEDAINTNEMPGHSTFLSCISQKSSHFSAYVDSLTFKRGTPANQIIHSLADAVGLPYDFPVLSKTGIPLSQSFTGLAFRQLEKFCTDYGYRVYILDGTLYVSSIYEPNNVFPKVINPLLLLTDPISTRISDDKLIEQMSISENTIIDEIANDSKNQRKIKRSKRFSSSDNYVEYDAVDNSLAGWELDLMMTPDLQPDDLLTIDAEETKGHKLRVRSVEHTGDSEDFGEWRTHVETSIQESN